MSLATYCIRHVQLQQNATTLDSAGGEVPQWTTLGTVKFHYSPLSSHLSKQYEREGFGTIWRFQAPNSLARRIGNFLKLWDALNSVDLKRIRFVIADRTFMPIGLQMPNANDVGPDVVNVDCFESQRVEGYWDRA